MTDLEARTKTAIGKLDRRLKAAELICQKVEDLMPLAKEVESVKKRMMRMENAEVNWRDLREGIYDSLIKVAQEMSFVRARLLAIEGEKEHVGSSHE